MSAYYPAADNEWVEVPRGGFKEQCCSCGHVHRTKFRVVAGKLEFKSVTDNRATAAARRQFKFTKEDD